MNFEEWWNSVGSGIIPDKCEDMETHTKKVCEFLFNVMTNAKNKEE